MATQPWWMGSLINGWGTTQDREGPYLKPDININDPAGTVFTAIAPSTVTGIDTKSSYGDVVTLAFDNPPNNVATHYEFEHLATIASDLFVGEHVPTGAVLGTGGGGQSTSGALPGFGLTDQAVYGTGSANEPFNMSYINPLLNPTGILTSLQQGGAGALGNINLSGIAGGACCNGNAGCLTCIVEGNSPATCCANIPQSAGNAILNSLGLGGTSGALTGWLTQAGLVIFGGAIILIALILVFNRRQ